MHSAPNQVIAILNFSENYSFVIQDEIQGFHWNKIQCTLHSVAMYWKIGSDLCEKSISIVSDDLILDIDFLFGVTKLVCKNMNKVINQEVNKLFCFSRSIQKLQKFFKFN